MSAERPRFDPQRFKESTREEWQKAAGAWDRWTAVFQSWLGPVATAMVEAARIGPGDRVLDVAAGTGEPALTAGERVGPDGYVLATDLSSNMLAVAEKAATERGLANVETRVMDGENLELPDASFDAALSRLGLIFFPDRQRGLSEIRRILRPGGHVALASFTTPVNNPFFAIPISIIRQRAQLAPPPPGGPGPFSLGDPVVMTGELKQAGFRDIETRVIPIPLQMASAAQFMEFQRQAFAALQQMMSGLSEAEQETVWAEIEQEMRRFEGPDGFEVSAEALVGSGVK